MLIKGVTVNKTDEDEPEVRRSSRLAEKSPVSFENLFLGPCDRSSAHQKSLVNWFLYDGNDLM